MKKRVQKKKHWTSYSVEFKIQAVKRVAAGEGTCSVARDLGIQRSVLYRWRQEYRGLGAAGRRSGQVGERVPRPAEVAARRISDLERKVGQQEVEVDFLRRAFERVKGSRRPSSGAGGTASTRRSA